MSWILYTMLLFMIFLMLIVIFIAIMKKGKSSTIQLFEVFQIEGHQFTVMSGIPVTYDIKDIQKIVFSSFKSIKGSSYMGIMRIVKVNGKKSRPFMFDSSVYKKRVVLYNSKEEIEEAIQFLMNELKAYHIPCSKA